MSGGAASATRNDGGPRVGASPSRCRGPLKRCRPRRSSLPHGRGVLGRPPSPPLAPHPPGRGGEASWLARAPCGRAGPGVRHAPRAAGPAPCPHPQAPLPRVLAPLPISLVYRPFIHPSLPQCSLSRPERKGPRPRRTKPKGSESSTPTSRPSRFPGDLLPGCAPRTGTRFGRLPPPSPTPPHGFGAAA